MANEVLEKKTRRGIIFWRKSSYIKAAYAFLYVTAAFLLFYNLSDRLLWGDEAETALLGRNILTFGVPRVYDGTNLLTQYPEPWESNSAGIWTWNTWLPYYAAAVSLRVFGESTFSARLPFALFGLLSILLVRKIARKMYEDEETALIATLLLAFSVPFLLHSRQCRYFSMLSFGTLWLLIGYNQLIFDRKRSGGIHLTLALAFLFYSSFIGFVGNAAGIGLHFLFMWKRKRANFKEILPPGILSFILILPWMLYSGMLGKGGSMRLSGSLHSLLFYIGQMNYHMFPLVLLLMPPLALYLRKTPLREALPSDKTLLLMLLFAGHLASLSIFPFMYFRYLITFAPILYLLEARILRSIGSRSFSYLLIVLLISSNVLGIMSLYPFRHGRPISSPLFEFVRGITSEYKDRFEDVLAFLKTNAHEGESLAMMDPGYPLMFYMRMKIIDARYPRNSDQVWNADWVLSESPDGVIDYGPGSTLVVPESMSGCYQIHKLPVHDTPLGASRPDPDLYRPLTEKRLNPLFVYQRVQPSENS